MGTVPLRPAQPLLNARQAAAAIAGLAAMALVGAAGPSNGIAPPPATTTRYMSTTDYDTLYNLGCSQTDESGAIILDFGQPWFNGSSYGTIIFGSITFRSIDDIENAVRGFLSGYYLCGGSGWMRLAVGTSNYRGSTGYGHGQAWAQMVNRLNDFITSPPDWSDREAARGASDIELSWNSVANSRAWVDGYASAYLDTSYFYNYGDAAGCPPYGSCNNGWTQEDVWYVSWGSPPAYPVPEIYTFGTAREWYRISLYGYTNHGRAVRILGTLTQWAAAGYCCTNPPEVGWQQLMNQLNADSRTVQTIPYSTDITWSN